MKKFIYVLAAVLFLTGCPKEEDIETAENEIADKKTEAISTIQSRDYSLDGLLKAQNYFFAFTEKVHLMIVDEDGSKNIKKLINKKGIGNFCTAFIVPLPIWKRLETYCSNGPFYKCSPEIKEYANTIAKFNELVGTEIAGLFNNESTCNN